MTFISQLNLAKGNNNYVPCQGLNLNFINWLHHHAFHKMAADEMFWIQTKRCQLKTTCVFWQTNQKEKSDIPLDPNLNAPGKHNNKPKIKTKQSIPVFTCQTVELQALTAK